MRRLTRNGCFNFLAPTVFLFLSTILITTESYADANSRMCVRLKNLSAKVSIAAENSARAVEASDKNKPNMLGELIELTRLFEAFKLLFQAGFADLSDFVRFSARFDAAKQDLQDRVAKWGDLHKKLVDIKTNTANSDDYTTKRLIECVQDGSSSIVNCQDETKKFTRATNKLNRKLKAIVRQLGGTPAFEDLIDRLATSAENTANSYTDANTATKKETNKVKKLLRQLEKKIPKAVSKVGVKPNVERSLDSIYKKWLQGRDNFEACVQ